MVSRVPYDFHFNEHDGRPLQLQKTKYLNRDDSIKLPFRAWLGEALAQD